MPKNSVSSHLDKTATTSTKKTPIPVILSMLILSFAFSLMLAEWVLSYQKKTIASSDEMEPGMIQYDKQLGWKLKPYWSGKHHNFDYDVSYTINSQGFRGPEFRPALTRKISSYAVMGDSFTFGVGVNDEQTFVSFLNKKDTDINASFVNSSFVNYSVPGYSTDQQLLSIKKLLAEQRLPEHLVLVLYLGNDVFDNMRAYPLQADHGKPYFTELGKKLVLQNTPVPLTPKTAAARKETISSLVLGEDSNSGAKKNWLSQLELSRRLGLFQSRFILTDEAMQNRFSSSLKLTVLLLNEIEKVLQENNVRLSIALLPGRTYVEQAASLSAQYQNYFRKYFIASYDNSASVKVIDLATQLRALHDSGIENLYYPNEGHLTEQGHQYVADYLAKQLSLNNPN